MDGDNNFIAGDYGQKLRQLYSKFIDVTLNYWSIAGDYDTIFVPKAGENRRLPTLTETPVF